MAYTNIDDPSAYFQTALYTGTGAAHINTNDGNSDLQPDWVWIKERSGSATMLYLIQAEAYKNSYNKWYKCGSTDATGFNSF
jgi:hypothetical protein